MIDLSWGISHELRYESRYRQSLAQSMKDVLATLIKLKGSAINFVGWSFPWRGSKCNGFVPIGVWAQRQSRRLWSVVFPSPTSYIPTVSVRRFRGATHWLFETIPCTIGRHEILTHAIYVNSDELPWWINSCDICVQISHHDISTHASSPIKAPVPPLRVQKRNISDLDFLAKFIHNWVWSTSPELSFLSLWP